MVVYCFSAVMWGAIRTCNSLIGGVSEFACLAESVDQVVCCAGTSVEHSVIRKNSKAGAFRNLPKILSQGAKYVVNAGVVTFCSMPAIKVKPTIEDSNKSTSFM